MIRTRILIISDTHCAALTKDGHARARDTAFKHPLPKADLLIHCGDLTMTGEMEEYVEALDMLKQIDAPTKLVIAGNHDLSLDRDFVLSHREMDRYARQPPAMSAQQAQERFDAARELWTAAHGRARQEGITLLDEGLHSLSLHNGAKVNVYASPYTPEFYDWGFPYERDEDRFNHEGASLSDAKNIASNVMHARSGGNGPIDIVVTHGPAWLRLDSTVRGDPAGCPHLLKAMMRTRPLLHCFGHIHEGWGGEKVRWSDNVDEVVQQKQSILEFKHDGWKAGVAKVSSFTHRLHEEETIDRHAAYLNGCKDAGDAIEPGKETLFVNAAIMDVSYKPANAPWLLDIELPSSSVRLDDSSL